MTRDLAERHLQANVLELCKLYDLLVHHSRPSIDPQTGRWATVISGDPGLPDLIIVGGRKVLYRELKSATGRQSGAQKVWAARLTRAGADVGIWRPADWPDRIQRELQEIR